MIFQTKHKVFGKALPVALYRLNQHTGFDAIEFCEIAIEHDSLPP